MLVWPVPESYEKNPPATNAPGGFWEDRGDRRHCGVDIYAPPGSEVVALDEGLVLEVGAFTSPEQCAYWNVTFYVLIEHRGGLAAKYAEMGDAVVTAGERVKAGVVVGHVGSVLDTAKIDATAPPYIQRLAQNNHGSMLHLELYSAPPVTWDDYLGGNLFTGERPANLVDAGHVLRIGVPHRPAQPAATTRHPGSENERRDLMTQATLFSPEYEQALQIGRPPNIVRLFPHSKALIVSGKVIDRALVAKGKAMTIAANGRNHFVIRGALQAAQRANAAIIMEIAKSEGGAGAYCGVSFWNLARQVDALCNEMGITVPVAVHADHYGIKGEKDVAAAKTEIPSLFDAGVTSIAIDASHLPDEENLLASIALNPYVPAWAGFETEVGEIKGKEGLSTVDEALFLVQGLNAHGIFPDWIALNNGTTHGIEQSDAGIQVPLTAEIHQALAPYRVSGAQHGTSGNSSERLRSITQETRTTKANVATALQMLTWGVKVNDYGNAILDESGEFAKVSDRGVADELWAEIVARARADGLQGGNYKKLNLPFENKLLGQPAPVRERMALAVEDFVYGLLVDVFNAADTASLAIRAILDAGSHDLGPKAERTEDPAEWTPARIREKAAALSRDKGPSGDFDD